MTKTAASPGQSSAKKSAQKTAPVKPQKKSSRFAIPTEVGPMEPDQWEKLRERLFAAAAKIPAEVVFREEVFGKLRGPEACYLYGLAIAVGGTESEAIISGATSPAATILGERGAAENSSNCDFATSRDLWCLLTQLATSPANQSVEAADRQMLLQQASVWLKSTPNAGVQRAGAKPGTSAKNDCGEALEAILWASAMLPLSQVLPQETWWQLLSHLQQYRADAALNAEPCSAEYLLLAGELGITLSWRLGMLPSCKRISQASLDAVSTFLEGEADSIDRVLTRANDLRLVVASLVRCQCLFPVVSKRKFKKRHREISAEFATWMGALLRQDGSQVLSPVSATDAKLDYQSSKKQSGKSAKQLKKTSKKLPKNRSNDSLDLLSGLMRAASEFDADTLVPAIAASLGQSHSGGRLAWEVSLPEAMWHSDESKLVAMLPEWDVRRGRSFVDYSGEDMRIEIAGGRSIVFSGTHQTLVQVDGQNAEPNGDWEVTCEYTDDDVHMIEMAQPFTLGVVLQRQYMVVREDRCVMISDAVLPAQPKKDASNESGAPIVVPGSVPSDAPELKCVSRVPLADGIEFVEDEETREVLLTSNSKRRCKVLPLSASEWRVGPSDSHMSVSGDHHLVVETRGIGAIYSPIWLDFQTRRFRRPSTWRPLTVADSLKLLPRNVAAGFRIQAGSEHWVLYRSLSGRAPRSFMGKHLIADFFAARFHPGDGGMEELVTVDDSGDAY